MTVLQVTDIYKVKSFMFNIIWLIWWERAVVYRVVLNYDNEGKGTIVSVHTMQIYGGMKVYLHPFITFALHGVSSHLHAPAAAPLQKNTLLPIE